VRLKVGSWFCKASQEYVVVVYDDPLPTPLTGYGWIKTYPKQAEAFTDMASIGLLAPQIAEQHKSFPIREGGAIGLDVRIERPKTILRGWSMFPVAVQ